MRKPDITDSIGLWVGSIAVSVLILVAVTAYVVGVHVERSEAADRDLEQAMQNNLDLHDALASVKRMDEKWAGCEVRAQTFKDTALSCQVSLFRSTDAWLRIPCSITLGGVTLAKADIVKRVGARISGYPWQ